MAERGKYSLNFYAGADYGLNPDYGREFSVGLSEGYAPATGQFGFPSNPLTANQLKAVSDKLSTGAKTIEVSGVNIMGGGPGALFDKIPKQHFKEINRLKKLTGADLTFHGPLIEPTGVIQNSWNENQRKQAETQMWSSVERAHDMDPNGNLVVTFHSSNGLPEPRQVVKTKDGKEVSANLAVVNEDTGQLGTLPRQGTDYFGGEGKEYSPDKELKRLNEENWKTQLSNVSISASRSRENIGDFKKFEDEIGGKGFDVDEFRKVMNSPDSEKFIHQLNPETQKIARALRDSMAYADIFVRDSYSGFKGLYNKAYAAAKVSKNVEDMKKLDKLRKEIAPLVNEYADGSVNTLQLSDAVARGIRGLKDISVPETFRPLKEFAIDKASETFSNVAVESYKKFGESAPIISIENPPVGMGLSRADELRNLIVESRKKFADKLVKEEGVSSGEAKAQAKKLIGATWDVGHINMIRKYGYDDEDVVKESRKIAPFVKHVHLSDNFGLEHTELPMGMGNVPIKKILELRKGFEKAKKIVETGDWFSQQGLNLRNTPFPESLRAFGSPLYSMNMAPYWNSTANDYAGYFSGYGRVLPEQHFAAFGAGFANLPIELGGQIGGAAGSSSGRGME